MRWLISSGTVSVAPSNFMRSIISSASSLTTPSRISRSGLTLDFSMAVYSLKKF